MLIRQILDLRRIVRQAARVHGRSGHVSRTIIIFANNGHHLQLVGSSLGFRLLMPRRLDRIQGLGGNTVRGKGGGMDRVDMKERIRQERRRSRLHGRYIDFGRRLGRIVQESLEKGLFLRQQGRIPFNQRGF